MEDTAYSRNDTRNFDVSISDTLADFERLRISALTNAAEISPFVKEVTIGPRSTSKKLKSNVNRAQTPNAQETIEPIDDKISDDLRYTLILKDYESRLQEKSEVCFKNLVEKMITSYADTIHGYWKKHGDEYKQKSLELKARKLQLVKQLRENDNLTVLEKTKLDEQKSQLINQQTKENMNRILEEENKSTARFASIVDSYTKICICFNEITNLEQLKPQAKDILDKYVSAINTIVGNIKLIMDFCKTGSITDNEVKQAELLSIKIENIKQRIIDDLTEVRQQEALKKQKEEEDAKQKELDAKQAQETKAAEDARIQQKLAEQVKRAQSMFYSDRNYAYYEQLKKFLDNYESSYKDLLDNTSLKKFRFDCQKAVNTPVNALSSVSGTHMRDKYDKLAQLLRGERVKVLDTFVTATQHPQGLNYCTALLAKKIVRQGDLLVSSNPEAAFPLAAVAVALWSQFPDFGKLLEAYFHKFCPYLVPMLLPQKEGQTDKEFYMSRGYTYNDEGAVEKQDKFLKRMSGIFRLNCAIWIAKTPRFINASNPHGLRYAWQWLASFINLKPEPDISATLIHDFFTVCGSEFLKNYKKQCIKIIKLLSTEYLRILQNIDEGGPKTRFEVFLQNVLKTGHIPPPNGLLPQNTW
ncbi:mRNA export factor Gle1 [Maniola hyperantus]|uniref:mRNA export factor Gle1 n=1 Tax=Aphantopus hyperantus TaxID=2795564 RepID=UPI00156819F5|nr:nucleoporin Gle1 [Maniola hyperantus]